MKPIRLAVLGVAVLAPVGVSADEAYLSGRPFYERNAPSGEIHAVAWSPDGRFVAVGTRGVHVLIVDATTGNVVHSLEHHFEDISSLAWRNDGKQLASASFDGTVGIWDTSTGNLVRSLAWHAGLISAVAWSPDGRFIAAASKQGGIRMWKASDGSLVRRFQTVPGASSIDWSPTGNLLVSGHMDGSVRLWTTQRSIVERVLRGHLGSVQSVAWSPDGQLIASGARDHTIRLWNARNGEVRTIETEATTSVAWNPDGSLIASAGGSDGRVRVWNRETNALVQTLEGHSSEVTSLSWNRGAKLVSGAFDKRVFVWEQSPRN